MIAESVMVMGTIRADWLPTVTLALITETLCICILQAATHANQQMTLSFVFKIIAAIYCRY